MPSEWWYHQYHNSEGTESVSSRASHGRLHGLRIYAWPWRVARRLGDGTEGRQDDVQGHKSIWELVNGTFWRQLRTGLGKAGGKRGALNFWRAGVHTRGRLWGGNHTRTAVWGTRLAVACRTDQVESEQLEDNCTRQPWRLRRSGGRLPHATAAWSRGLPSPLFSTVLSS